MAVRGRRTDRRRLVLKPVALLTQLSLVPIICPQVPAQATIPHAQKGGSAAPPPCMPLSLPGSLLTSMDAAEQLRDTHFLPVRALRLAGVASSGFSISPPLRAHRRGCCGLAPEGRRRGFSSIYSTFLPEYPQLAGPLLPSLCSSGFNCEASCLGCSRTGWVSRCSWRPSGAGFWEVQACDPSDGFL